MKGDEAQYSELEYCPENPIPRLENDDVECFFNAESLYAASESYAGDENAKNCRDRAAFVIAANSVFEIFDPFVPYLALNYFDRCTDPISNNLHDVDIIAISCLVLAWKMRDINFTTTKFLSSKPDLVEITTERLARVEILILEALDWCLRPVTPFCFVPYFAPKFDTKHGISEETIDEIIIYQQYDEWFTRFKPSVIAASAFLAASYFLYADQHIHLFFKITSEKFLQGCKEDIKACTKGMVWGCNKLRLAIESDVSNGKSHPELQVRAGDQASDSSSEISEVSSSSSHIDWLLDWKEEGSFNEVVVSAEEEEEEEEEKNEEFGLVLRGGKNCPVIAVDPEEESEESGLIHRWIKDLPAIAEESEEENEESGVIRRWRKDLPPITEESEEENEESGVIRRWRKDLPAIKEESEEENEESGVIRHWRKDHPVIGVEPHDLMVPLLDRRAPPAEEETSGSEKDEKSTCFFRGCSCSLQ